MTDSAQGPSVRQLDAMEKRLRKSIKRTANAINGGFGQETRKAHVLKGFPELANASPDRWPKARAKGLNIIPCAPKPQNPTKTP